MITRKEQSRIDAAEEEDEEDKDDQEAGTQRADGAPRRLLLWPINHGRSAPQYFITLKISARGSFDYSFFLNLLYFSLVLKFYFSLFLLFLFVACVFFCFIAVFYMEALGCCFYDVHDLNPQLDSWFMHRKSVLMKTRALQRARLHQHGDCTFLMKLPPCEQVNLILRSLTARAHGFVFGQNSVGMYAFTVSGDGTICQEGKGERAAGVHL